MGLATGSAVWRRCVYSAPPVRVTGIEKPALASCADTGIRNPASTSNVRKWLRADITLLLGSRRSNRDRQTECEPEGGAPSQPALQSDPATHAFDQFLGNGKTQPGTSVAAGEGTVSLDKFFKNQRAFVLR